MDQELLQISFEGMDAAQAAGSVQELAEYVRNWAGAQAEVHPVRRDPRSMDLGTSLLVTLSAAAGAVAFPVIRQALLAYFKGKVQENELAILEKRMELEKLRREGPLVRVALRQGGEVQVGYVSPQLVYAIRQLIEKTKAQP